MAVGKYYLGRVIKLGRLDQDMLMNAIVHSPTVQIGKFAWAITDVVDERNSELPYVFGKLSKFSNEGHVTVVDTQTKEQVDAIAENLLVASSPFVYLPKYSGIAFLHVWNEIQEDTFPKRFKKIIEETYDSFFVDCSIQSVSDYQVFTTKLKEIAKYTEIHAKVNPPNPLFGRLWKELDAYVKQRNAGEVKIEEKTKTEQGLRTKIPNLMSHIIENPKYEPDFKIDIADAALLMSADGYGNGKVIGQTRENKNITVRTSETQKNFDFDKEPEPRSFAEEVDALFSQISSERNMGH